MAKKWFALLYAHSHSFHNFGVAHWKKTKSARSTLHNMWILCSGSPILGESVAHRQKIMSNLHCKGKNVGHIRITAWNWWILFKFYLNRGSFYSPLHWHCQFEPPFCVCVCACVSWFVSTYACHFNDAILLYWSHNDSYRSSTVLHLLQFVSFAS